MPHRSAWLPLYRKVAIAGLKVSVVATDGGCLAMANWSDRTPESPATLMGKRWHEYVNPEHLPRLLDWFRPEAASQPPIIYEGLGRVDGVDQTVTICLVKAPLPGGVWLCVGEQRPAAVDRPGTPWQ